MDNANELMNNMETEKGEQTMERFVRENGEIVELTTEFRNSLIYKIIEIFDWCDIYPECDYDAVGQMVDEWFIQKIKLINLFAKSSFWNEERLAIDFSKPILRKFDKSEYNRFLNLMRDCAEHVLKEVKIGNFTYAELDGIIDKLANRISALRNAEQYGAIVKDLIAYATEERDFFQERLYNASNDGNLKIYNSKAYIKAEYETKKNVRICLRELIDHPTQFLSEEMATYINNYFEKFGSKEGQKTSRVVNKLCKMIGLDKITYRDLSNWCLEFVSSAEDFDKNAYNVKFAKFADACNPFQVTKHILISLNPVDYLSMSWGDNWGSCHDIDKEDKHNRNCSSYSGCYSSGTESYMLDGSSVVMFIEGADAIQLAEERKEPVPRKEMRQMFHITDEKFIQGRLYPYDQTDRGQNAEPEEYIQYREIMQSVLAELWDVPNLWTNKRGNVACGNETQSDGTHYRDYTHYDNVNVSFLKNGTQDKIIYIGHDPICPRCGEEHGEESNCFCYDCQNERRRTWCDYHECYEPYNEDEMTDVENYGRVCGDALDNGDFVQCECCGTWIWGESEDTIYSERDNVYFCDERCAERHGYYYVGFVGDYLREDDFQYSEINEEDLPIYDMTYHDLCWAVYDVYNDYETVAYKSSCTFIDGRWYDNNLCCLDINGDDALKGECVKIDGKWYRKDMSIKDMEIEDAYVFYKKIKKFLIENKHFSYEVLKQYLFETNVEEIWDDVA